MCETTQSEHICVHEANQNDRYGTSRFFFLFFCFFFLLLEKELYFNGILLHIVQSGGELDLDSQSQFYGLLNYE